MEAVLKRDSFETEQIAFVIQATFAGIAADMAFAEYAVAGNEDRYGIMGHGSAN